MGKSARLVVRDHGIGISERDQERIFDRFERAVSSQHYGGFGLGLWISRQIAEGLGGSIQHEVLGQGETQTATARTRRLTVGGQAIWVRSAHGE
ncbi:PAS domain-containing sensor histidine kinase [Cystobacter fuscus]|uniref:histidine kinase n=1 Tax=Cystobacter fuscus TaxID=43 RepID=A0A250J7E6_9BACT|nr:PAS domain-containing sensor histidine kinase [Cystobacter fuscus]